MKIETYKRIRLVLILLFETNASQFLNRVCEGSEVRMMSRELLSSSRTLKSFSWKFPVPVHRALKACFSLTVLHSILPLYIHQGWHKAVISAGFCGKSFALLVDRCTTPFNYPNKNTRPLSPLTLLDELYHFSGASGWRRSSKEPDTGGEPLIAFYLPYDRVRVLYLFIGEKRKDKKEEEVEEKNDCYSTSNSFSLFVGLSFSI